MQPVVPPCWRLCDFEGRAVAEEYVQRTDLGFITLSVTQKLPKDQKRHDPSQFQNPAE